MSRFYSQPIDVQVGGEMNQPVSFRWNGKEYQIREVWGQWHDAGFGPILKGKGKWWLRRHRNYYRVITSEDEVFELYLDRGAHKREWFLYRKIESE